MFEFLSTHTTVLYSVFSLEDIADMDAEVEDICNDSEESDTETKDKTKVKKRRRSPVGFNNESSSSSADSLAGKPINSFKKKWWLWWLGSHESRMTVTAVYC